MHLARHVEHDLTGYFPPFLQGPLKKDRIAKEESA